MKKPVLLMSLSAMLIALLLVVQLVFSSLGQFYVGPLVNLLLILAALFLNRYSAMIAAFLSPLIAFSLGIGTTLFVLVPWIAIGNFLLVIVVIVARKLITKFHYFQMILVVVIGLFVKISFYWITLATFIIPSLALPDAAKLTLIYTFTWSQVITGIIGLGLTSIVYPLLLNPLRKYQHD